MSEKEVQKEIKLKKAQEEVSKILTQYPATIAYLASDAPIGILCLEKGIEKILISNGFLRLRDILNTDLTEIKGLGRIRLRKLTSRLDEFLSML